MRIIILSGRPTQELDHLTLEEPVGALQVVNKSLLNFTLETLQEQLGVKKFEVLAGIHSEELINKLEENMLLEVSLDCYDDAYQDQAEDILWVRDDVLYDLDFSELRHQAQRSGSHSVAFFEHKNLMFFYQKNKSKNKLPTFFSAKHTTDAICQLLLGKCLWHCEQISVGKGGLINTVADYYQSSMALLKGEFGNIILDYHQQGLSLVKGMQVNISDSTQLQQNAFLGDSVYVHQKSRLYEDVILCKQSYVDSCVDISNSIIMPSVYIGPYLNIKNSVVTGNAVIRVDTGDVIPIQDKKILADLFLS